MGNTRGKPAALGRLVIGCAAAVAPLIGMADSAALAGGARPDTLLVVGDLPSRRLDKMNRLLFDGLAERGFEKQRYVAHEELVAEDLATARLVLYFGGGRSFALAGHDRGVLDALTAYVENGGGLVIFNDVGQQLNRTAFTEHLLNAFGGGILMEIPVVPEERYLTVGTRGRHHLYTDRVFLDGIAARAEIRNILLHAEFSFNTLHGIQGCKLGEGWRCILSAGEDVAGAPFPETGIPFFDSRRSEACVKGDYPVVAVREFGRGRVCWWGMNAVLLMQDTNDNAVLERMRAMLFDGVPGHPKSDLFELVARVFDWAGEGSAGLDAAKIPQIEAELGREGAPGTGYRLFRGVIGPRTTYSTGRSTPAEYVARAKALGHDFIVFLEDFAALTQEGFDALQRECEAFTDDSFTAWAGYTIDNEDGNHEFVFTREPMYPGRVFLTGDGKRLACRRSSGSGSPIAGSCTELQFYYGAYGFSGNVGWYGFNDSPYRRTDIRAAMSMGVVTRVNGVETDRALDAFAINCDNNQAPMPVALELMDSADGLGEGSFVCQIGIDGLSAFRRAMTSFVIFNGYPGVGSFGCYSASSGPSVELKLPRCDPADDGTRLYNPKLSRWPFELAVRAKAGVDVVELCDGDKRVRRWKGGGRREFSMSGVLSAERQHHYWVKATDLGGGEAFTRAAGCVSQLLSEWNCTDRMNQYLYSSQRRGGDEPPFMAQRAGETCLCDKGPWTGRVRPVGFFVFDKKLGIGGSGGFDGSPEDHPQLRLTPSLAYGDEKPASIGWVNEFVAGRAGGPHVEPRRVVAGANALVADRVLDGTFPLAEREIIHVWRTLKPVEDCPWADTTARCSLFLPKIDGIAPYQWEQTLTLKRDMPAPSDGSSLAYFGNVRRSKHTVSFNAHLRGVTVEDAFGKTFDMVPGDYLVAKDSQWGSLAVFPMTAVRYEAGRLGAPAPTAPGASEHATDSPDAAERAPAVAPAGTAFEFRAVLAGMHRGIADPDAFAGEILAKYAAFEPRGGVIRDEAADDGAFTGSFAGLRELPGTLGFRLSGLSDNRSAVLALPDGWIRLIPVEEGIGYVALGDEESDLPLFIGHPVRCADPDIGLYLALAEDWKTWRLEVHNPTDREIDAEIATDPRFRAFALARTVHVPPCESIAIPCE